MDGLHFSMRDNIDAISAIRVACEGMNVLKLDLERIIDTKKMESDVGAYPSCLNDTIVPVEQISKLMHDTDQLTSVLDWYCKHRLETARMNSVGQ
jgi:hypothetical protein